MNQLEQSLRKLVDAIINGNSTLFSALLTSSPALATSAFTEGATRQGPATQYFLKDIGHYIYPGDTALHFAAASYRHKMAIELIHLGASPGARNRRGAEPLHAAAVGNPASPAWDPTAQQATIVCLIQAGADPNARNIDGATPLHRAVRSRCAGAVQPFSISAQIQQSATRTAPLPFNWHSTQQAAAAPVHLRQKRSNRKFCSYSSGVKRRSQRPPYGILATSNKLFPKSILRGTRKSDRIGPQCAKF